MNAADFQQVRELLTRHRAVLDAIKRLCLFEPDLTPEDITRDLVRIEDELGAFIEVVQNRRRMTWEDRGHRPRHDPPARWSTPQPDPHVRRFDVHGRTAGETTPSPRLSGVWLQTHPRRRRHG